MVILATCIEWSIAGYGTVQMGITLSNSHQVQTSLYGVGIPQHYLIRERETAIWTGNTMSGDGIHFLSFHNYICQIQQMTQ